MASRGRRPYPRSPPSESQSGPAGTSGTSNPPAAPSVGSPPALAGFMPESPFPARLVAVASEAMKDRSHAQAIPDSEKRRSNATWAASLVGGKITPVGAQATTSALPAAGPSTGQSMKSRERDRTPHALYKRIHTKRHDAEQAATSAWFECAKVIKDHHEGILMRWKEEIDTLLVYAGLFSAVLTAFTVETYVLLQPSPTDTTNVLLVQMSAQLNSFTVDPTFVNSTQHFVDTQPQSAFRATLLAVWINTLWFSSLICSLTAASIGMMVKQWLHENELGLFGTSRDIARLRQYRYEALRKWHVGTIVALLPILLQLASALFLAGLLVLLWSLHQVVAAVASALVGTLLVFTIVTVLAPAFAPDCAYRSPQALAFVFVVQTIRRAVWTLGQAVAYVLRWRSVRSTQLVGSVRDRVVYLRWAGIERPIVQKHQHNLDQQALLAANALVLNDSVEFTDKVLRRCVRTLPSRFGHRCLKAMCGDVAPQPGLEHRNLSASSGKAVSLALEVIESHLDGYDDSNRLSQEPIEVLVADLRRRLEFPYIDVKVSVQLYETLARLLETYTNNDGYTIDVFRILDDLSHRRWLHPAHYQSISCGNAAQAITKAFEGLLSRATTVDLKIDMHHRLIKFLAVCHLRPGFCHHDVQFAQKRLLEQLHALSDLISGLDEGRYNAYLTHFNHHLYSLTDPKFINFLKELHEQFPEAEKLIRYLAIYLSSEEVLERIANHAKMDNKVRDAVERLYDSIRTPPEGSIVRGR